MSVKIMGRVWDLDLPANEQMVLLALADHADHAGENVWPSNGLIAWKIGASEDTVARLKKRLVARGILVVVEDRPGRTTLHKIDLSKGSLKPPYRSIHPPQSAEGNPPQSAAPRNLRPPAKLCGPTPRKAVRTPPPAKLCGTNRPVEPSSKPPKKNAAGHTPPASGLQREFILLWEAAYAENFGMPYAFAGAKDGVAATALVKIKSPTELVAIARAAWVEALATPFPFSNAVSIAGLRSQWQAIVGTLALRQKGQPARGQRPPPVPRPGEGHLEGGAAYVKRIAKLIG